MIVAHLAPKLYHAGGGVSAAVHSLSRATSRAEVHVVGITDTMPDCTVWDEVTVHEENVVGPRSLAYAPGLRRTLERINPDIVHRHGLWMYYGFVGGQWQQTTGRPLVISPHGMLDSWALSNSKLKKKVASVLFERRQLQRASCLHALNDAELRAIRDCGIRSPVAVIPNGVELPDETPFRKASQSGEGVPPAARVMLYLGRIHPKKGLRSLLEAFAIIRNDPLAADWNLAVVGWDDGGHQASLQEFTETLALADRVQWLGPRFGANKHAMLRSADAFVLPSHSEGLPLAVLEAWSYGMPVLMTDACNLPEGFDSAAAHRLHTAPLRMADDLRGFFKLDDAARVAMGLRGRALVTARFTSQRVGGEMLHVYEWLLNQQERPSFVDVA